MLTQDILFEALGWLAVILTFLTYSQKTMLMLRILGIGSNLCFIVWAASTGVFQPLALHCALLPLNGYRLYQILRMKREADKAQRGEVPPLSWLKPYVRPIRFNDGEFVFRIGQSPQSLYYLVKGRIDFDELGKSAAPGEIFGEVAFLTAQKARTASARCVGDCEVLALDAADLATISLQHPAFNFHIMRVMAERLTGGVVPATAEPQPFPKP